MELLPGKFRRRCCPCVHAVDASNDNNLSKLALVLTDSSGFIIKKNRHILKCPGLCELFLNNGCGLSDDLKPLFGHLSHNPCGQSRTWKGNSLRDFSRESQDLRHLSHPVFAKCLKRFQNLIAVLFLRINSDLGQNVVLAFDACDGLFDVCEDGSMEQKCGTDLADKSSEDFGIEGMGDGVTLLLRIGQSLERT